MILSGDVSVQFLDYGAFTVKRNSLICLILGLLVGISPVAVRAEDATTAIEKTMQTQTEAWNRGDVDGFMTAYKESVDTTYIGKQIAQGYEHIRAGYKEHYTSPEAMGIADFLRSQGALPWRKLRRRYWKFALARSAAAGGPAQGVFSLVWEKTSQGWKIILDHTS